MGQAINLVLTVIFAVEMTAKMLALGLVRYYADKFNRLDCFIVVTSLIELAIEVFGPSSKQKGGGGLSVLRTFRLLRKNLPHDLL